MNIIKDLLEAANAHTLEVVGSDPLHHSQLKFEGGQREDHSYVYQNFEIQYLVQKVYIILTLEFRIDRAWSEDYRGYNCNLGDVQINNVRFVDDNDEQINGTNTLRMVGGIAAVEKNVEDYLEKHVIRNACELLDELDKNK